jgi:type I restriction enzyme, R subunit
MGFNEDGSVEKPAILEFQKLGYDFVDLYGEICGRDNELGRETRSDVVLVKILKEKIQEFNPVLDEISVTKVIDEITRDRSSSSLVRANQDVYALLKDGVPVSILNDRGEEIEEKARVIDWNCPDKNEFLLASQMWISGTIYTKRPDLIGFVNGIPLILFELKKPTVSVKDAFDKNLKDYKTTIPQLFWYNAFVILSNGSRSKIGTMTSPWKHFNEWKKINNEGEEGKVSLDTIIKGTCEKTRFIDLLENFTTFSEAEGKRIKIIAKNHQYHGVNKAIPAYLNAKKIQDQKIGVFWHTTGSGKSYSMIFFSNKIFRKKPGNYTFLIITDRETLDNQIYKNFEKTGASTEPENAIRAQNSKHLQQLLKEDHRHIFTLIHKFRNEKTESGDLIPFPILSERDDIIVIADEAHRTQYGDLALNMRISVPNAAFIAFTATPLLAIDEKTREIFGDYVSVYNFKQSIDDGATVPLYYVNRKPEVEIIDQDLNQKILDEIEEAELDEDSVEKLRKKYPKEFHVITKDDRLDIISKDIVEHFMGRGYRGKAMVISIDRFTTVKMYNKVQFFWHQRINELEKQYTAADILEKETLRREINYMNETDMAVVISNSQNEENHFQEQGLDIIPHRKRIINENLEEKFKNSKDPFRIVFVCAMWTTGFDAPSLSTIYLDKPLRDHTLIQTISRANRVFGDKRSGMIVDYYGILKRLQNALKLYGSGPGGEIPEGGSPVKNIDELVKNMEANLQLMDRYFHTKNYDPKPMLTTKGFEKTAILDDTKEVILENDESRITFFGLLRLVWGTYTELRPDTRAENYRRLVMLYIEIGEAIAGDIEEEDLSDIERQIKGLIDASISVLPFAPRKQEQVIDLSQIDLDQIKVSYKAGKKRTEAAKLRSLINRKLAQLLALNQYRIDFQERLEHIVDDYNNGSINIEEYFQQLTSLFDELKIEDQRHIREGLTIEQLALYDILSKPVPELTKKEETTVKNAAKELLRVLKEQKLVLDWKKKNQLRAGVQVTIWDYLSDNLPDDKYTPKMIEDKRDRVFQHIYDSYLEADESVYAQQLYPIVSFEVESIDNSYTEDEFRIEISGLETKIEQKNRPPKPVLNNVLVEFAINPIIQQALIQVTLYAAKKGIKTIDSRIDDYFNELLKKVIGKIKQINILGKVFKNDTNLSNEEFLKQTFAITKSDLELKGQLKNK